MILVVLNLSKNIFSCFHLLEVLLDEMLVVFLFHLFQTIFLCLMLFHILPLIYFLVLHFRRSTITFGLINLICESMYSLQMFASSFSGFLFCRGLHFTILVIYMSSLFKPIPWSALFMSCPAFPTKGIPCSSSSAPGPSPINIISAFLLPVPITIFFLVLHNLHFLQFLHSFSNSSQFSKKNTKKKLIKYYH